MLCRGSSAPRQMLILLSATSKSIYLRLPMTNVTISKFDIIHFPSFLSTSSQFYTFIIVIVRYLVVLYQFYVNYKGSCKKLKPFFKDFSRTTLDFQGPPTRNIISQIVQKCTLSVYSNQALRLELFASPTSRHFSLHLSQIDS